VRLWLALLEDLYTVDGGEVSVQDDGRSGLALLWAKTGLAGRRRGDVEAVGGERLVDDDAERLLVVDDQHARFHAAPLARSALRSGSTTFTDAPPRLTSWPSSMVPPGAWM